MSTTRIYLARHGQTDWNVQGILQGQTDVPLNGVGVQQAKELRDSFAGMELHAFHSSDLIRARHTAEIVASQHAIPVVTHPELRERFYGMYQGKPIPSRDNRDQWVFEGEVESIEAVRVRFHECLERIARAHAGQTVFVVAHSGTMRRFLVSEHLLKLHTPEFNTVQENGGYAVLQFDGERFLLERVGRINSGSDPQSE